MRWQREPCCREARSQSQRFVSKASAFRAMKSFRARAAQMLAWPAITRPRKERHRNEDESRANHLDSSSDNIDHKNSGQHDTSASSRRLNSSRLDAKNPLKLS